MWSVFQYRWVRTITLVFLSMAAPFAAVFFALPARTATAHDLDNHPPIGRYVQVTFDRVEPLPWTIVGEDGTTIVDHFALGYMGKRVLIVQTGSAELPTTTLTVTGELHALRGIEAKWAKESPDVDARSYDAILEIQGRGKRLALAGVAALVSLGVLIVWLRRLLQARRA